MCQVDSCELEEVAVSNDSDAHVVTVTKVSVGEDVRAWVDTLTAEGKSCNNREYDDIVDLDTSVASMSVSTSKQHPQHRDDEIEQDIDEDIDENIEQDTAEDIVHDNKEEMVEDPEAVRELNIISEAEDDSEVCDVTPLDDIFRRLHVDFRQSIRQLITAPIPSSLSDTYLGTCCMCVSCIVLEYTRYIYIYIYIYILRN